MEYIDVRGVWPTYISGMNAVTLVGAAKDITLEQAKALMSNIRVVERKPIDKVKWTAIWIDSIAYWNKWLMLYPNASKAVAERIRNAEQELEKLT